MSLLLFWNGTMAAAAPITVVPNVYQARRRALAFEAAYRQLNFEAADRLMGVPVLPTDAPVQYDAASESATPGAAEASRTFAHTCTGQLRVLLVGILIGSPRTVSTVTYNSVAMTLLDSQDGSASIRVELWGLVNPSHGANNIVVTPDAAAKMVCGGISLTSARGFGTPVKATGTGTTASVTVSSAAGEMVVDIAGAQTVTTTLTAGAGQTERFNEPHGAAPGGIAAGSTEAGAASVVMSWTVSASVVWASIGVPVLPSLSPAFTARARPLNFEVRRKN